jgi:hypothetical protein
VKNLTQFPGVRAENLPVGIEARLLRGLGRGRLARGRRLDPRGKEAECALPTGRDDAGFDGADALEAPAAFGDGLGEIDFEGADGSEGFADAFAMSVEGGLLSGGENVALANESVFVGIETSAKLTYRGWRSWGVLGVGLVSGELNCGGHVGLPRESGLSPNQGLAWRDLGGLIGSLYLYKTEEMLLFAESVTR